MLYRPPDAPISFFDSFYDIASNAIDSGFPIIMVGDFNINMLSTSSTFTKFNLLLQKLNLTNIIHEPTNFSNPLGTCIDLIITNKTSIISNSTVKAPICSTHSPVSLEMNARTIKKLTYKRTILNYQLAEYDRLNSELFKIDWTIYCAVLIST